MSAIKDFFKKKKADAKFKLAGSGHKLSDPSSASRGQGGSGGQRPGPERAHPSQSSQQAGAAALNRIVNKEQTEEDLVKARQRAKIKERARQELEREQKIDTEVAKIKAVYGDKEEINLEGPQHLAVTGVFFRCDLIGGEPGPREVIKARIREFLYSQLESEDKCLTAVLIIHTCNSPRDKVEEGVKTLGKLLGNIINNPAESKYRKIRKSNRAFNDKVASLEGSQQFLEGCGFVSTRMEGAEGAMEEFWVFPEENTDFDSLAAMRDTLEGAEPVRAELDRQVTVMPPSQKISRELPPDFFNLTKEELKVEQQRRTEILEREGILRTKAMREKEEAKAKRRYKYCLIRVRFPDGWVLQGTFSVYETLSQVMELVTESLSSPLPYILVDSATGSRLGQEDMESSLLDLSLVPASLLNFCWDPEIEADLARSGQAAQLAYLRPELKQ